MHRYIHMYTVYINKINSIILWISTDSVRECIPEYYISWYTNIHHNACKVSRENMLSCWLCVLYCITDMWTWDQQSTIWNEINYIWGKETLSILALSLRKVWKRAMPYSHYYSILLQNTLLGRFRKQNYDWISMALITYWLRWMI